jgi:hypothetical protein
VLDTEQDPRVAEQKMRIAIERVQDPDLIPQNEKWTVEVYKALAQEFKELNQYRNTVEVSELILKKWPMHRDAPVIQAQIADIYDTLTNQSREGTPSARRTREGPRRPHQARALRRYDDWVEANKDDPEALQAAERLVRGGLRRAAADHTNAGSALAEQAITIGDKESRDPLFERALSEYKLAAQGWSGYLNQDENSPDAYESRFWLADANHMIVDQGRRWTAHRAAEIDDRPQDRRGRARLERGRQVPPARRAWSSTSLPGAARRSVQALASARAAPQGIEPRKEVNAGTARGRPRGREGSPAPADVQDAVAARDEYVQRVPPAPTRTKTRPLRLPGGGVLLPLRPVRGREEALRAHLRGAVRQDASSATGLGTPDDDGEPRARHRAARKLAAAAVAKSCAVDAEQKVKEGEIATGRRSPAATTSTRAAFKKAQGMADGDPERVKAWREAAALYKVALEKAPLATRPPRPR